MHIPSLSNYFDGVNPEIFALRALGNSADLRSRSLQNRSDNHQLNFLGVANWIQVGWDLPKCKLSRCALGIQLKQQNSLSRQLKYRQIRWEPKCSQIR